MNMTAIIPGSIAVTLAVMGWFLTSQSALSARVDTLATQEATTQQASVDTGVQLAQIEAQVATEQTELEQLLVNAGITPTGTGGAVKK